MRKRRGAAQRKPLRSWRVAIIVEVAALGCLLACQRRVPESVVCVPCRPPFERSPEAAASIERQWQTAARALGETRTLDLSCLCFGPGDSALVEGQNIYLASAWERREQTARTAHLALHRADPPLVPNNAACEERVEQALHREVEAHLLELATRRALGVTDFRYRFEGALEKIPAPERARWLYDYFTSHPEGDGDVPGFVSQYRKRCYDSAIVAAPPQNQ